MSNNFIQEALARMRADGLSIADPICDGARHNCGTNEKPRGTAGRYIIHNDDMPVAWWINWQSEGVAKTYQGKSNKDMTPKERKAFKERMAAIKEQERLEREATHKEAAISAKAIWDKAKPATGDYPYLKRKGVKSYGLRIDYKGKLTIPMVDIEGNLQSLAFILPYKMQNGNDKLFLPGGKKAGCFYEIAGKDETEDGPLLIGEGYATMASCHEATGYACIVAFDCHNLMAVTLALRAKYPTRKIVLCADYDFHTDPKILEKYPLSGGIGVAKAKDAAEAIGAYLATCPPHDGGKQDFNDLAVLDGLPRVKDVIDKALAAEPANSCPMPHGYKALKEADKLWLYYLKEAPDGTVDRLRLGPMLEIIASTSDKSSENWGKYLKWADMKGKEHKWAMPMRLLNSQHAEWYSILLDGGWAGNPAYKKYVGAYLAGATPIKHIMCVDKIGWHDDSYVLPDFTYGNKDIVLQQSHYYSGLYQVAGTLEDWQEVARLCVGNSRLGFALSCAFAGPLLSIADLEGGGFSFEGGSSSGKTTALKVAASVWGGKEHVRNWRTTDNGLEGAAALHNDNVLILDEVSQVKGRVLDEAVYMLANGSGKGRSGKDGCLKRPQHWRVILLSSGELGLADKLAEDGKRARAGQDVRFVGISVEKTHVCELHNHEDAGLLVRRIADLCAANYGHAGRAFLQKLIAPYMLETIREVMPGQIEWLAEDYCPEDADPQVKRVAMRFAVVGYAGYLAKDMGILPTEFDAFKYAKDCFEAWLEKRGGAGAAEDAAILAQVGLIIERDGQSRFEDLDNPNQHVPNMLGYRKNDNNGVCEYIILPQQFKNEFANGFSVNRVANVLDDIGWLCKDRVGRLKSRRTLPRFGRCECYIIKIQEKVIHD